MSISAVTYSPTANLAFKAGNNPEQKPAFKSSQPHNYEDEYVIKKGPATAGKKWGVGLASWFCPGLGQAINGEWGKGLGIFLGQLGLGFIAGFSGAKNIMAGKPKSMAVSIVTLLGAAGLGIWSVIDAVKNAKSEVLVPANK